MVYATENIVILAVLIDIFVVYMVLHLLKGLVHELYIRMP